MKIFRIWLCICLSFLLSINTFGQDPQVAVGNPEKRDSELYIPYDILHSTSQDLFEVQLFVYDELGNEIEAKTLRGDVGPYVKGGAGKYIIWSVAADGVPPDQKIKFKIRAETMLNMDSQSANQSGSKDPEFNRAGLIIQSALFPGLGLSRYKGGPHWLKGVAAYSCVAGSVVLNRMAIDTYGQINESTDLDEKEKLYEKSVSQDNISEGLAYGAIAIWAVDLIWTFVGTSDLSKKGAKNRAVVIDSGFDPVSGAPLLVLNYRF